MRNFMLGLTLGVLFGGLGVAGAQFYPGMPPNVRDAELNRMLQMQEQQRQQDFMFQNEMRSRHNNPC